MRAHLETAGRRNGPARSRIWPCPLAGLRDRRGSLLALARSGPSVLPRAGGDLPRHGDHQGRLLRRDRRRFDGDPAASLDLWERTGGAAPLGAMLRLRDRIPRHADSPRNSAGIGRLREVTKRRDAGMRPARSSRTCSRPTTAASTMHPGRPASSRAAPPTVIPARPLASTGRMIGPTDRSGRRMDAAASWRRNMNPIPPGRGRDAFTRRHSPGERWSRASWDWSYADAAANTNSRRCRPTNAGSSNSPSSTATTPRRPIAARSRSRSSPSRGRASRSPRRCSSRATSPCMAPTGSPKTGRRRRPRLLKAVPEQGGLVLLQDGWTVKTMTADEFKAAPKAAGH